MAPQKVNRVLQKRGILGVNTGKGKIITIQKNGVIRMNITKNKTIVKK